jgi:hypothetical protein
VGRVSGFLMRSFRINIIAPVGPIGEAKIRKLQEVLEGFSIEAKIEPGGIILLHPESRGTLVLAPQQITLGFDQDELVPNFEFIRETFSKMFETLLLDPVGQSTVQIMGTIAVETGSSMENSIKRFALSSEPATYGITGLKGVGLRFLIDHEPDIWEFKVEPFIKDESFYFLEAICGNNQTLTLEQILAVSQEAYTSFVGNWRTIAEEYLIERG